MDKDRIAGAAKQAKGAIKEATGKALGDAKLTAKGKNDKAEGKVQNAIGGVKDAVRDSLKP
jgi:uncharacterized protein YjbJ (UPF0337 family)